MWESLIYGDVSIMCAGNCLRSVHGTLSKPTCISQIYKFAEEIGWRDGYCPACASEIDRATDEHEQQQHKSGGSHLG